ncbi:uncharacterized protein LOC114142714 [Xiphophorus couchianus]|uniref:uncharacterized protein LOC114142714 n=1 Tax=Xiphophorus couchianus TaxID=32473 RepID=UPI001016CFBF|nr:uncharacterized protein LOC114142714 [Xiphophorus couchianus]
MEMNVLLMLLPFLTGVFSLRPKTIYTRTGEMVVLRCPQKHDSDTTILWTNQTRQGMDVTSILSTQSAALSQMDVLLHGHILVILSASLSHQGNYSCSARNASRRFWFSLIVYEPQSREYEERNRYSTTCYTQESCTLYCPTANIPAHDTPNITGRGITWHKEGETVSTPHDFPSAVERDGGIYKCIRSFLYDGQIYNMSFSVVLEIQKSKYGKSEIISPHQNDVFHIDLGSTLVIECKAVAYSDYDVVFWLSENSFVDTDESLPVFYNYSSTKYIDEVNMTASLVFKDVSEEDLLKKYTCKLESDHQQSSFITISLAEKRTPGICPVTAKEIYANAGDLVMLNCRESKHDGTVMLWKMEKDQEMHLYSNMSASEQQKLDEPQPKLGIYLPKNGQIFEVELGTKKVIACKALVDSCQNEPYWTSDGEFVDDSDFFTDPCENEKMPKWMNTSLIFREVSPENLSKTFTCAYSSHKLISTVNITLVKIAQPSHVTLIVCSVCVVVSMVVIVVVYVKFKIDVTLFLRDKVGFKDCRSSTSDGRSYDAFLMCYKSITDGGLSEEDRKCLASTLENEFGYSICLYDRDVLPGQAVADAVLDCIQQSRAVVLIPGFPDPEPGSAVLSAIHSSLVERKTRLIFINTEQTEASTSGSFPEALQLLSKAGNSVTWKGRPPPTSFWKQLRYHLPAPQQTPKMQLLSQEC